MNQFALNQRRALEEFNKGNRISCVGMPVNQFIQKDDDGKAILFSIKNQEVVKEKEQLISLRPESVLSSHWFLYE